MTEIAAPPKPLFHQLWNGESAELCARFKPGSVDCIITDPPYGSDNKSNMATTREGKANARKIANDESPEVAIANFNRVMDVLLPKTAAQADMYVFTSHQVLGEWLQIDLRRHDFQRCGILVWEKDGPGMGDLNGTWGQSHEYILFFKKGGRPMSDGRRAGVFYVPQIRPQYLIHPHEKPTALLAKFIKFSTNRNDFIVDPFAGSGATVRASKELERSAVGIELDKHNWSRAKDALEKAEGALL